MSRTTLYRLYAQDDVLLYVGITKHWSIRSWWAQVVKVEVEQFPTWSEALAAERQVIAAERPRHNRSKGQNPAPPPPPIQTHQHLVEGSYDWYPVVCLDPNCQPRQ
jgi:hypothetical protein